MGRPTCPPLASFLGCNDGDKIAVVSTGNKYIFLVFYSTGMRKYGDDNFNNY